MSRSIPTPLERAETALAGRKVMVTGHTGFCGGWLSLWLNEIGCAAAGVALPPETEPNLFSRARIADVVAHAIADVRDKGALEAAFAREKPEVVFHLAAQPLVRRSYREPADTVATNVAGTANVLAAALDAGVKAAVVVTTDKVYRSREWVWPYRETDELGGHDPYSASKAAAEIVTASFRHSFGSKMAIATARGGNIIGGGDWSEDRLIPDFVRAVVGGSSLTLRNPASTRPWQHVLALCHGYIALAGALLRDPGTAAQAWNFGPAPADAVPVSEVIRLLTSTWRPVELRVEPANLHETKALALDSTLAHDVLGWRPAWSLEPALAATAEWYRDVLDGNLDAREVCRRQIAAYRAEAVACEAPADA